MALYIFIFVLGYNLILYYFVTQIEPVGVLLGWLLYPCSMSLSLIFEHFLESSSYGSYTSYLVYFLPLPENQSLLQEGYSEIRIWAGVLSLLWGCHCFWNLSADRSRKDTYITYVCTCIIIISIFLSLRIYFSM